MSTRFALLRHAMQRHAMRSVMVAGFMVATPAAGAAQTAQGPADTTFTLSRNALVDITVRQGSLLVRGSDRSEGSLRTNSNAYTIKATGAGIVLGARQANGRSYARSNDDSRVELLVPRGVRLVISAGSADVEVRDIEGDVEVRSFNGDIRMDRLGGRAIVETLSGDLTISGGVGDVRVTTSSGDVTVGDFRGEANVQSTSGDIALTGARSRRVTVQSISGDADFSGSLAPEGRVQISTHSGDVLMRVSEETRGTLEFETHTGEMQTTTPITMVGPLPGSRTGQPRTGQRYEFGGGGSVMLMISTFNGDVRFERGTSRSSAR